MDKDRLPADETSIGAQLSKSGISFGAKSRTIAALDFIGASKLMGRFRKTYTETDQAAREKYALDQLTMAAVRTLETKLENDEEAAAEFLNSALGTQIRRKENVLGATAAAIEDLSNRTTDEGEADEAAEISDAFMDRWERYAEGATTDELKERWGAILSKEIRKPGSISPATMRVVDELDKSLADLFQSLFSAIAMNRIIQDLMEVTVSLDKWQQLTAAGLVIHAAGGTSMILSPLPVGGDRRVFLRSMRPIKGTLPVVEIPKAVNRPPLTGGRLQFKAIALTTAGVEIHEALGDRQGYERFSALLRTYFPEAKFSH
ncbi:DUF2806 domain-containing protein [Notoacmeibacter ruber]|uniref:DUF2806 domain-containing protein n=1 Tax=Notoacmeibacter ruber TaxID=2670375 RepID=A0A3L7JEZ8_9HYPH|nr:DUF2806 domain-containing protein [Notoacmeibacter ruber]RLQ88905.1 DUF2806 domain-containing protein [Notoacmeibacter ruber]